MSISRGKKWMLQQVSNYFGNGKPMNKWLQVQWRCVYTRVLTRIDLNPDSNPAIEVGWVNPG
jgi:hypothetical protein